MSSNTIFLTNLWKVLGMGKSFGGLVSSLMKKNLIILCMCFTYLSCCISLKMTALNAKEILYCIKFYILIALNTV